MPIHNLGFLAKVFTEKFDREFAIQAILAGGDVEKAVRDATSSQFDAPTPELRRFIVIGRKSLDKIPSPSCVAEYLKNNPRPTREDIMRAFERC